MIALYGETFGTFLVTQKYFQTNSLNLHNGLVVFTKGFRSVLLQTMVCMVWYDIFFNLKPPYHKEASWTQYAQGTIDFVRNCIVCLVAEAVQWKLLTVQERLGGNKFLILIFYNTLLLR